MIFKHLLPSRWRKASGEPGSALATPAPTHRAVDHPEPSERRQACKQLTDLVLLARIRAEDPDAGVRELAGARLRNLLSGQEPDSPSLDTRLERTRALGDARLAAHLALHGKEPELRREALGQVEDHLVLAECALQDPVAAVRLLAVERLEDKTALEQVLRQIGKKDKGVYRLARQKLKDIADREEAPRRLRAEAEALCERLERLGRRAAWTQDQTLASHLEQQWAGLASPPADLAERFAAAQEAFAAGHGAHLAEQRAREQATQAQVTLKQAKQALIQELEEVEGEDLDATSLEHRLAELEARWEALERLPEDDEAPPRRAFQQALRHLQERLDRQRGRQQRDQRLERLLKQGRGWLEQAEHLDPRTVRRWLANADALADPVADTGPGRQYADLRAQLTARLDRQTTQAEQKLARLEERLDQLERELDAGALKKATALRQSIQADLELIAAGGMENDRFAPLERRLRHITPRLREMQNWRKWGTDQHRAELCATMEGLIDAELSPELLTERVQTLQAEWKDLDQAGSPVNEGLWRRFHEAANRAFERCRPYLEEQVRRREDNRRAREALCQELEGFLARVDWERVDWRKVLRAEREMRQFWASLEAADARHQHALEKRFHTAMKRLNAHLAEERARNLAMRQDLVARANALVQEPDLERAIQEVRGLQQAWHTSVPTKRSLEHQIWQHFRAACDQVFERRRAQQVSLHQELSEHLRALESLCEELEGLGRDLEMDPDALTQQLHRLQGRWDEGRTLEVPRRDLDRLQRRWQIGAQEAHARVRRLRRREERVHLDQLRARADLCQALERQIQGLAPAETAQDWQTRWEALPPPTSGPAAAAAMERRFQDALGALTDPVAATAWRDRLAEHGEQRRRLCLHLEVLTGVESPPDQAQERLMFQINRLSERLGHREADPLDAAPKVEEAWYLCGPASAPLMETLEARFERARVQLSRDADPGGTATTVAAPS